MAFVVAEFDPREISFFHYDRAFRVCDPRLVATESVQPGSATSGSGSTRSSTPASEPAGSEAISLLNLDLSELALRLSKYLGSNCLTQG